MTPFPALAILLVLAPTQAQVISRPPPAPTPTSQPAAALATPLEAREAGLVASQPVVDLGKVKSPETKAGTFTITNSNSKPIRITGVSTTCGCTVASPAKQQLDPGESTPVPVTFASHGFAGPLTRGITLRTDDPAHPTLELTLKVQVETPYFLMPHSLFLSAKSIELNGTVQSSDFRFAPVSTIYKVKDLRIEPATTPLKVTWAPAPGGEIKGKVTLDPTALPKAFRQTNRGEMNQARLVLRTEEGPTTQIDITWQVLPLIPDPAGKANLGVVPANAPFTRTTPFNAADGGVPFRVMKVSVSNPALKVETPLGTPALTHSLLISSSGMKPGPFRETISVITDSKGPILVPVIGVAE